MLRHRQLVPRDLAQGRHEVDDGVAVQVARARENPIDGHDDALGTKKIGLKLKIGKNQTMHRRKRT